MDVNEHALVATRVATLSNGPLDSSSVPLSAKPLLGPDTGDRSWSAPPWSYCLEGFRSLSVEPRPMGISRPDFGYLRPRHDHARWVRQFTGGESNTQSTVSGLWIARAASAGFLGMPAWRRRANQICIERVEPRSVVTRRVSRLTGIDPYGQLGRTVGLLSVHERGAKMQVTDVRIAEQGRQRPLPARGSGTKLARPSRRSGFLCGVQRSAPYPAFTAQVRSALGYCEISSARPPSPCRSPRSGFARRAR